MKITALLAIATLCPPLAAPAEPLFTGGVRTSLEQGARGHAAYARACAICHGPSLEGSQFGPPLKGETFERRWRETSFAAFDRLIRTTMPPTGRTSLSDQGYRDIEAFILQGDAAASESNPGMPPAKPTGTDAAASGGTPGYDPSYRAAVKARDAKLAGITVVTDAMLTRPPPSDWLMWRRTYDGLGYSPLRQITRSNVARLRTAWALALPDGGNEITPLVHDGVMFVYSGSAVLALDAASGELLWQYVRALDAEFDGGRRSRAKALAIYRDKLFAPTPDGHVIALEARTGRLLWDHEVAPRPPKGAPPIAGVQLNSGPIVARGNVIIGVSLDLLSGGGCFIVGLDAATGREAWRFNTIARPDEPGGDSWNDAPVEQRFGAGVWTVGSYDPELDLVYFGIGNTYNSATLLEPRPGAARVGRNDGLYTDSTVALRPETGELVWHYQHLKRDVWDMDWVFEQSVVKMRVAGRQRKLVVTGGKLAIFDAVDAATGAFVFSKDLGLQNLIVGTDPVTGEKSVNAALQPQAGKARLICPGNFGARNWPATALNPDTRILYVPMVDSCADYIYRPRDPEQTARGGIDMFFIQRPPPGGDGQFGRLAALDLEKRSILWTHRQRVPMASSALATAGGLIFSGDLDRYFLALDHSNGKILWRTRLSAAPESSPVTYEANGKQYLAVVSGGGSAFGANGRGSVPEVIPPAAGVTVTVFELP